MATITVYPKAKLKLINGGIDLDTDTMRVLLLSTGYTYDAGHEFVSDLTPASNEHDGDGYARQTVGTPAVTQVSTSAKFDAEDVVFSAVAVGSADLRYAAIYKQVGGDDTTPENDPLIALVNFGLDVTPSGNDITIEWNASGIFTLS